MKDPASVYGSNVLHSRCDFYLCIQTWIDEANYSYGSAVSIFQAVMALILVVLANKAARKVGQTSLW